MKFDPTWPQIALLAILLGTVILAYAFAPASVVAITGMVTTILGGLLVNLQPGKLTQAPPLLSIVRDDREDKEGKS
jgi:hypothetical protein